MGAQALLQAVSTGAMLEAQGLVLAGVDVNARREKDGATVLHLAVKAGSVGVVRLLIEHKADVSALDTSSCTPLHLATRQGYGLIVSQLLEAKADTAAPDTGGRTALADAVGSGDVEAMRRLLAAGAEPDPDDVLDSEGNSAKKAPALLRAVQTGAHVQMVKELIQARAAVEGTDRRGNSALHAAGHSGDPATTKFLLQKRADPNCVNYKCRTPLHYAASTGCIRVIRALVHANADPNIRDDDGLLPMGRAGDPRVEQELRLLGAWGEGPRMAVVPISPPQTPPDSPAGSSPTGRAVSPGSPSRRGSAPGSPQLSPGTSPLPSPTSGRPNTAGWLGLTGRSAGGLSRASSSGGLGVPSSSLSSLASAASTGRLPASPARGQPPGRRSAPPWSPGLRGQTQSVGALVRCGAHTAAGLRPSVRGHGTDAMRRRLFDAA